MAMTFARNFGITRAAGADSNCIADLYMYILKTHCGMTTYGRNTVKAQKTPEKIQNIQNKNDRGTLQRNTQRGTQDGRSGYL
ncbi:MAG: hypothetical protein OSJ72_00640 [Lachnospiraceae bacterium]|nr:hypothetical protein [Lachnospiraceae bacterium]